MSSIITITNQKGGVGKTTTTACLASGLSAKGDKVLCVDMDPQGNLGFCLGLESEDFPTIHDVLINHIPIREAIQHADNCDVVTSDISLSGTEMEFEGNGRECRLQEALAPVMEEYDYIIIDTPPSLNILTINAYVVSDYLIITMTPQILSLVGVSQLKETIDAISETLNPHLKVLGLLLTRYEVRPRLSREVAEMAESLAPQLDTIVFNTKIRCGVAAAEAPAHGECVQDYSPRSNPGKDYRAFVDEVYDILHQG